MIRHHLITCVGVLVACLVLDSSAQVTNIASIEVVGGPMAGTHTLSASDVGCIIYEASKDGSKPKRFDMNFGLPPTDPRAKDPRALTLVQVVLRNASGKGPLQQADYVASLTFGPFGDDSSTWYMSGVDPLGRKGGTGTVVLQDEGTRATVTLDLQPKPGVSVKGTVTCTRISRV